jgi:hypothetical protein
VGDARGRGDRAFGVGPALETVGRLGVQAQGGSQYAASSATARVESETSLLAPPMIPASASGASGSATTPTRPASVRSTPSSVVTLSPSRAQRITRRACGSLARSKACDGWPISIIT